VEAEVAAAEVAEVVVEAGVAVVVAAAADNPGIIDARNLA
jgi:hypothetical protein